MINNIVLVHGAFADGSSWSGVIRLLQARDFNVTAVHHPLTSVMSAVQMPWKLPTDRVGHPAWRSRPSWYQISERDQMISPQLQHFMAERMGARIVALDASHASAVSQAGDVAGLIASAAESLP